MDPTPRRDFLKLAAVSAAGALLPLGRALAAAPRALADHRLVLVELAGGNDGLSMVAPFADPAYAALRPRLALGADRVLRLGDGLGLHPGLEPLMPSWASRELAVVLGVGYENPNRSHFRSGDIWETASDSDEVLTEGWLARALPPDASATAQGIVVGRGGAGPLLGAPRVVELGDPERFIRQGRRERVSQARVDNPALAHVLALRRDIRSAADELERRLEATAPLGVTFPDSPFGRQLETAARVLVAGVDAPVVKLTLTGFDTHANQRPVHDRLMAELGQGLAALRSALVAAGSWQRTLVLTTSEFGRRAGENGSGGTDHGTAAPALVLGGRVAGGLHGAQPSLTELSSGDLRHAVDFRRLYATVLERWWGLAASAVVGPHRPLDLLR